MILLGVALAVLLGLLLGGRLAALASVRVRFAGLLIVALVLRFATQLLIAQGVDLVDQLRLPLYATAFVLIGLALWPNRGLPGLLVVMVGVLSNGLAIVVNGGWMPVYVPALAVAGLSPSELSPTYHVALPEQLNLDFLLHAGPLGDIVPFPVPIFPNVVSLGDVLVSLGLGWFVLATMLRGAQTDAPEGGVSLWRGSTEQPPSRADRAGIGRPIALGGGIGPGQPPPALGRRIRGHPWFKLMRDARFSAFWLGQTISLFGDRLNQIAIGVMVYAATGSPLQTGLVFLAATLPNVFLGPIAGTFVDRWDQKRVMILSDLIRAGLVVLVPFVAERQLWLVYPLVFLITTVSLFFRPAKSAVVPRLVDEEDLLAANSAIWTGETFADIAGYPLAGLFVAFLGGNLALAFWVDAATYLVSALLLAAIVIPPVVAEATPRVAGAVRAFVAELREGWGVLRRSPPLFQNTLISAVAQASIGALLALVVVYSREVLDGRFVPYPQSYAAIEAAMGIGSLVGGLVIGAVGARLRKGHLIVAGFVVMGLSIVVLGLTSNVLVAIAAAIVMGIFNLVYAIPTQTLFGQLVPAGYMGRVVAFRTSLVFGALTGAMAVSAALAEVVDPGAVIAVTGAITVVGGVAGALLPAVRDA